MSNESASTTLAGSHDWPNKTTLPVPIEPLQNASNLPCQVMLYKELGDSMVRVWDVAILAPNLLFLLFLLIKLKSVLRKLRRTSSPIFSAFFSLVFMVAVIGVIRCVVSMTVNAALPKGDMSDQILWLVLRFFLLATELSVLVFGLGAGQLDRSTSIRVVLAVTFTVSLAYSTAQGCLEFMHHDAHFQVSTADQSYQLFGHGGMLFWILSSAVFTLTYLVVCVLPCAPGLRRRLPLPQKRSFYLYCGTLAVLNCIQTLGSALLYFHYDRGLCVVNLTSFLYFTLFAPFVYFVFLRDFFRLAHPPHILFSYKSQQDDEDDQSVHMPEHSGGEASSVSVANPYSNTHFEDLSPNPLYYDADQPGPQAHTQLVTKQVL